MTQAASILIALKRARAQLAHEQETKLEPAKVYVTMVEQLTEAFILTVMAETIVDVGGRPYEAAQAVVNEQIELLKEGGAVYQEDELELIALQRVLDVIELKRVGEATK